jgi:hypothetical protein
MDDRQYRRISIHLLGAVLVLAAAVCPALAGPSVGRVTGETQTLRYFVKDVSTKMTKADGTVISRPPFPEPAAGDVLEINAVDYKGNHRRHARKWTASQIERCAFAHGPPTCQITVAIGGSLLVFNGDSGRVANGTGRYQRATGRILKVKDVRGGRDVTARIRTR